MSIFGALPVALLVRDHQMMATFSMASVGFTVLFAAVIVVFAFNPAGTRACVYVAEADEMFPESLQHNWVALQCN